MRHEKAARMNAWTEGVISILILALAALTLRSFVLARAVRSVVGEAGIQWVRIPGGSFTMGAAGIDPDAQPHVVAIKSFQLARTLVTNKQYKACVAAGACSAAHVSDGTCYVYNGHGWSRGRLPKSLQGDDQPVVCVDWEQSKSFSTWVGGRLPSEAEWEYAARSAGKNRKYPWGDEDATCDRAVIISREPGCGKVTSWPVCSKPAGNTDQGLCDMAGNAWEWMEDWYHSSYDGAPTDGRPREDPGTYRVVRGGAWIGGGDETRSAFRFYGFLPGGRVDIQSFRPAR